MNTVGNSSPFALCSVIMETYGPSFSSSASVLKVILSRNVSRVISSPVSSGNSSIEVIMALFNSLIFSILDLASIVPSASYICTRPDSLTAFSYTFSMESSRADFLNASMISVNSFILVSAVLSTLKSPAFIATSYMLSSF